MPNNYKWVIIKHKNYDIVRNYFRKGWINLPQVDQDEVNVRKGIKGLGAREEDIVVLTDQSFAELRAFFKQLREQVKKAWYGTGKRTLVFIFYGGHGMMDNTTFAVTNETP